MLKKRAFIILWYVSIAMFLITILFVLLFVDDKTIFWAIFIFAWIGISVFLFCFSEKKIMFPEGYTAVQATFFYRYCNRRDISTVSTARKEISTLCEYAQKFDFLKGLSEKQIVDAHNRGKKNMLIKGKN